MKKIVANLALVGSLMISAAVLSPLFHMDATMDAVRTRLSLLVSPPVDHVALVADAPLYEVGSRSDAGVGLLMDAPASRFEQFCAQSGLARGMICAAFGQPDTN